MEWTNHRLPKDKITLPVFDLLDQITISIRDARQNRTGFGFVEYVEDRNRDREHISKICFDMLPAFNIVVDE